MARDSKATMQVGEWTFDLSTGELRRRGEVRRVEPRAARALHLLCEADGAVVSQDEFVAKVWDGRSLSENSLSVVIGQLRRALDDDPREPRIVETIPKRGYRLGHAATCEESRPHIKWWAVGAVLAIVALFAAWAWPDAQSSPQLLIAVREVANETGDPAHGPLARATGELLVDQLASRGFDVNRGRAGDLDMRPKLIIWDGRPFLSLSAVDSSGKVRWSAMLDASPGKVPPNVDRAFDELAAQFPPADGAERVAKAGTRR